MTSHDKKSKMTGYFTSGGPLTPRKLSGGGGSPSSKYGGTETPDTSDEETDHLISTKKKDRKISASSSPQLIRSFSTGIVKSSFSKEKQLQLEEAVTNEKKKSSSKKDLSKTELLKEQVRLLEHIASLNDRINAHSKQITTLEIYRERQEERIVELETFVKTLKQHQQPPNSSGGCFSGLFTF